jgi:hypothetical protein
MLAPGVVESRIRLCFGVAGSGFALRAEVGERSVARALARG